MFNIKRIIDTIAKEEAAQDILTVAQEISSRMQTMEQGMEVAAKEVTAADILTAVQSCNSLLQQILDKTEVTA